jgi:hypothetical protein
MRGRRLRKDPEEGSSSVERVDCFFGGLRESKACAICRVQKTRKNRNLAMGVE